MWYADYESVEALRAATREDQETVFLYAGGSGLRRALSFASLLEERTTFWVELPSGARARIDRLKPAERMRWPQPGAGPNGRRGRPAACVITRMR